MPRRPRKESKSNVYHCMLRGINQQDIFFEKKDYLKFKELIKKTKEKYLYQLYSYVLMPNHIHLEIKDENQKLSQIIHSLATSYATYFNKKYQRKGHLFENRFLSKNVEDSYYILNLIRYIHQNPVKASISKLNQYNWSSYPEYFNIKKIDKQSKIVDTEDILLMINENVEKAQKEFWEFNNRTVKFDKSIELLEYEIKNKLTDEEVIYFINEELNINNIQEIQKYNKKFRDEVLHKIMQIKGITKVQIARVTGINIKTIKRAL